jgi:hypothetical protein
LLWHRVCRSEFGVGMARVMHTTGRTIVRQDGHSCRRERVGRSDCW